MPRERPAHRRCGKAQHHEYSRKPERKRNRGRNQSFAARALAQGDRRGAREHSQVDGHQWKYAGREECQRTSEKQGRKGEVHDLPCESQLR